MPQRRDVQTLAVIGGGPAGLAMAKEALAGGLDVVVFEQRGMLGGTWNYCADAFDGNGVESSAMYRSVTANASRPFLEFSDFPIPDTVPVYPRHSHMSTYFQEYAAAFGVTGRVRFGCRVVSVESEPAGKWTVGWEENGRRSSGVFDAVAVANGHLSTPRWPKDLPGFDVFGGAILHSRSYKTPRNPVETEGRRVLVVGIGNSGCDIATDLAGTARQVILSSRSGGWVFPRWLDGRPVDQVDFETRFSRWMLPEWLSNRLEPLAMRRVKRRYFGVDRNVKRWGLQPAFGPYEAHAAVNEQLFPAIGNGSIVVKGAVTELLPSGAQFADGSRENVDVAIFATGFSIDFPFLSEELFRVDKDCNGVELYRHMLSPDLPETLAFAGLVQPQTGFMPIVEMQARWLVALWTGRIVLPSPARMRESIARDRRDREQMYVDRPRHSIEIEWPGYTDRLAAELGAMPRPLRHPGVLRSILFEPIHASQYRLDGPGASAEMAERAIARLARNRRKECFSKS